jgi:Imelysin
MKPWRIGIATLFLLALAGCGSSSGPTSGEGDTSTTAVVPDRKPAQRPDLRVTKVSGTNMSPAEAAKFGNNEGPAPGPGSELRPLRPAAFHRPVAEYRTYAEGQARAMAAAVARLQAAIAAGDRAAAERAWFAAYDRYLRLGAAYGALGNLDRAIDGNPGALPGGVHDPHFTGLHRVEYGLWTGAPVRSLTRPARVLAADVARLGPTMAQMKIDPLTYATRAHEILEDAQRDMLSGVDAPWSGAGLRATVASLAATEAVIDTLRPLLGGRGSSYGPIDVEAAALRRALASVRRDHDGAWPREEAMTQAEHERVDGALGSLLETLAEVPGELETEPARAIPTITAQARSAGDESAEARG